MLLDALSKYGSLTPKGQPGPTSVSATESGIKLDVDGPVEGSGTTTQPVAPPQAATQPTGAKNPSEILAALRPFLSALLGLQVP